MSDRVQHAKDSQYYIEKSTALRLCEVVNTPRALAVAIMLRHDQTDEYLALSIDPDDYLSPGDFAKDYMVTEVLRKSPNLPGEHDPLQSCLQQFYTAEELCRDTNQRFVPLATTFETPSYGELEGVPYWPGAFREQVRLILGPLRPKLDSMLNTVRVGSGADIGLPGRGIIPPDKFDYPMSLTPRLIPFFRSILGERWWEHQCETKEVVDWNEFFTVPKDAVKHRGACKEPRLNLVLQLSIGQVIRRVLRRCGIDLDTQPDVNREMAGAAFELGLATIDLSAASDTLASTVVTHFFPEDWAHLLELARVDKTLVPSTEDIGISQLYPLEKFSSMGNGFTFELETVVFLAACRMCVPQKWWSLISVFGDDIIVPQAYADRVVQALELLGFRVNKKKTCLAGKFFESCGTDWWGGFNVRPFHLKGKSGNIPYELQIANKLRLWAARLTGGNGCDKEFIHVWKWLESRVPVKFRECSVTPDLGDVGLIRSWPEAISRPSTSIDLHGSIQTDVCSYTALEAKSYTYGTLLYKLSMPAGVTKVARVRLRPSLTNAEKDRNKVLVRDEKLGMTYLMSTADGNSFARRGCLSKVALRGCVNLTGWHEGLEWT